MKYRIAIGMHIMELESMVNELIAIGWKPIGGITIDADGKGDVFYLQAMVIESKE